MLLHSHCSAKQQRADVGRRIATFVSRPHNIGHPSSRLTTTCKLPIEKTSLYQHTGIVSFESRKDIEKGRGIINCFRIYHGKPRPPST